MSAVTKVNVATQTMSFDEIVEEAIRKRQRAEEVEEESAKRSRTAAERIVEELRPLCSEVPNAALDPVSMEPLDEAMVTRCSHTFNWETLKKLYDSIGIEEMRKLGGMPCPTCRWVFHPKSECCASGASRDMVEIFKKIEEVFKKNDAVSRI